MPQQLDWRSAAAARGLKVTDLAERIATSIEGIDLSDDLDAEIVSIVRAACVERTLLLFRSQEKLTPSQFLTFAQRFGGRPDLHALRHYCLPDHHEIFVVGNVHEKETNAGSPRVGLNWHTDHYHLPEPGLFTYLHAIQVPDVGGDTLFSDMHAAYDALDQETKDLIEPLICEHSQLYSRDLIGFRDFSADERERFKPVLQRLVRTLPRTGRKSVYLSSHAGTIVGWEMPEARLLLRDLSEHATQREFVYSHKWRVDDLVMWDNRQTMHRGRPFPADEARDVRRTTLAGHAPTVEQPIAVAA